MKSNNSESTWSQIEKRLNLQSIGEFIRYGGDISEIDKRGFAERLAGADKDLQEYIEPICGNDKADDMLEKIAIYENICKDIYFALGMKVGAQIIIQLTGNFESDFWQNRKESLIAFFLYIVFYDPVNKTVKQF